MSAAVTLAQLQGCAQAALADDVTAIGGIAAAATETGHDDDTIRRWIRRTHGDWTLDAAMAVSLAGLRQHGRLLLVERIIRLVVDGDPVRRSIPLTTVASKALPDLLTQAQVMSAALRDGRVDRDEARAMVHGLSALISQLESLHTEARQFLGRPK